MNAPEVDSRGKQPRGPRIELIVKVEFESLGQLRADFLSNLSEGGMFVRTPVSFAVGQVFQVQLSLPGVLEPPMTVDAEVRWTATDRPEFARGVGVAFRGLSAELQRKLKQVIASAIPAPAAAPVSTSPQGAQSAGGAVRVCLLAPNAILRDIICGELERLSHGGTSHAATRLEMTCPPTLATCVEAERSSPADVLIVDADSLGLATSTVIGALREAAPGRRQPLIVLQAGEPPPRGAGDDASTIVLRKPVGMKSLYTTLLALAAKGTVA